MKQDIHPEYKIATVHCSCGNTFQTRSTKSDLRVEICSNCHPFYTGKQKLIDAGGRVERFQRRYAKQQEESTARGAERERAAPAAPRARPASRPAPEPAPEAAPEPEAALREPEAALREPEAALREPEAALPEPEAALPEPEGVSSEPALEPEES